MSLHLLTSIRLKVHDYLIMCLHFNMHQKINIFPYIERGFLVQLSVRMLSTNFFREHVIKQTCTYIYNNKNIQHFTLFNFTRRYFFKNRVFCGKNIVSMTNLGSIKKTTFKRRISDISDFFVWFQRSYVSMISVSSYSCIQMNIGCLRFGFKALHFVFVFYYVYIRSITTKSKYYLFNNHNSNISTFQKIIKRGVYSVKYYTNYNQCSASEQC